MLKKNHHNPIIMDSNNIKPAILGIIIPVIVMINNLPLLVGNGYTSPTLDRYYFDNCVEKELKSNPNIDNITLTKTCNNEVDKLNQMSDDVSKGLDTLTNGFNDLPKSDE
jgi:hypothetical protein